MEKRKIIITTTDMKKHIVEIDKNEEFDEANGEMENGKTIFMIEEGIC